MANELKVFVSHSHQDTDFCRSLVQALRQAGADVWYDEHNLGSGQLMEVIQRELDARPIFVVILSKHAFASRWVKRETTWAYELYDRNPTRLILPVTVGAIERDDFSGASGWLFLHDFKRIEAAGYRPLPLDEAARRMLHALALTPAEEAPQPVAPQPSESADDLLARGKALQAQGKHVEALPLFQRATHLRPSSFEAWCNLGSTLLTLNRYREALPAYERATVLDPNATYAWINKGSVLNKLQRFEEALVAYDRTLALDPDDDGTWLVKGLTLMKLQRYEEALAVFDRMLDLDPDDDATWTEKGSALYSLQRFDEALAAYDRALALDPTYRNAWTKRGTTLSALGRYDAALAAYEKGYPWRTWTADGFDAEDFRGLIRALRALGRTSEAEQAERRATEAVDRNDDATSGFIDDLDRLLDDLDR